MIHLEAGKLQLDLLNVGKIASYFKKGIGKGNCQIH